MKGKNHKMRILLRSIAGCKNPQKAQDGIEEKLFYSLRLKKKTFYTQRPFSEPFLPKTIRSQNWDNKLECEPIVGVSYFTSRCRAYTSYGTVLLRYRLILNLRFCTVKSTTTTVLMVFSAT